MSSREVLAAGKAGNVHPGSSDEMLLVVKFGKMDFRLLWDSRFITKDSCVLLLSFHRNVFPAVFPFSSCPCQGCCEASL